MDHCHENVSRHEHVLSKLTALPLRNWNASPQFSRRFRTGQCIFNCFPLQQPVGDSGHFQLWDVVQSELAPHYILYTRDLRGLERAPR